MRSVKHYVWAVGLAAIVAGGCADNTGNGALIGGAAGAGIGAIIGSNSHGRTAEGALIGGAVGAVGGAVVGNQMDRNQDREYRDRYDDGRPRRDDLPPPPPRDDYGR